MRQKLLPLDRNCERFNLVEAIGIILTIGGVILITYTRNTTVAEFFGRGSGWILVSSVLSSVSEASRTMIIQSTRSLFVLIGSMIYLSILPEMLQLTGELVTISGVIVMTWGKMKFKKGRNLIRILPLILPKPHYGASVIYLISICF